MTVGLLLLSNNENSIKDDNNNETNDGSRGLKWIHLHQIVLAEQTLNLIKQASRSFAWHTHKLNHRTTTQTHKHTYPMEKAY